MENSSNTNKRPTGSYFQAGGTLKSSSQSYVMRPADEQLYKALQARKFAYILTSRQMGKSSLMIRTSARVRQEGFLSVIIDLTTIGSGSSIRVDQWYLSLLNEINKQLELNIPMGEWWQKNNQVSPVQSFTNFIRYEVLERTKKPVVLFIDEIDSTLGLDFSDDFFAGVRSMFNARAQDQEYERIMFVLLGVATPTDLMKDERRTPFNVGVSIDLKEFRDRDKASIDKLKKGLDIVYPGRGDSIFNRIFYWTDGHPYLTQKLCLLISESKSSSMWPDTEIDNLVRKTYFEEFNRVDESIQFTSSRILNHPDKIQLLNLYEKVVDGEKVKEDPLSIHQGQLKIAGLVREEDGILAVPNRIYERVFNAVWIAGHKVTSTATKTLIGNSSTYININSQDSSNSTWRYAIIGIIGVALIGIILFFIFGDRTSPVNPTPTTAPIVEKTPTEEIKIVVPTTDSNTIVPTSTVATIEDPTGTPIPEVTEAAVEGPPPTEEIAPTETEVPTKIPTEAPRLTPDGSIVLAQAIELKTGGTLNFLTLGTVEEGSTIRIVGTADNPAWVYVETEEGLQGFVMVRELDIDIDGLNLDLIIETTPKFGISIGADIYDSADRNSKQNIGVIGPGNIVEVTGRSSNGSWLYVMSSNKGIEGFAGEGRIDWGGVIDDLPVIE